MDNSSLDLSKVVSLIMENPKLIGEIKSLMENKDSSEETVSESIATDTELPAEMPESNSPPTQKEEKSVPTSASAAGSNRRKLLTAFKPYLSGERQKALDSIVSIADVIDAMKAR